jgi:hypothetical protein
MGEAMNDLREERERAIANGAQDTPGGDRVIHLIHRGYRGNRWFNSDFAEIRSGSPK